jgi:hypothetical protein
MTNYMAVFNDLPRMTSIKMDDGSHDEREEN